MMFEPIKTINLAEDKETTNTSLTVRFRVPSCVDMEELENSGVSNSKTVIKFVEEISGFASAEEFVKTPGTAYIAAKIAEEIVKSSMIKLKIKN